MEEWFHDCNKKEEVNSARPKIANVLKMLQDFFFKRRRYTRILHTKDAWDDNISVIYEKVW